ncbi:pyrophosphatase [Ensifer sesbaniae]|jgi:NTP pyrophosphatase (non-canonical NTP hydrolase)|uniref:pyrophosphatase n=1 Tax=Ensifer sesbaniae TaxID=1214071 RepID=UPI002000C63B|nr:pyrophosphatase [Ensifer sesbaniae]
MLERLGSQFETASAGYAGAHGIERDSDWFILKMQEELGELTQVWNKLSGRGRRHGKSTEELTALMADETADLLGHVLLFAHHHKLDLPAAIERKWRFQATL